MDLLGRLRAPLDDGLVLGPSVVVSHLDTDVACVPSSVLQRMPLVALAASGNNEVFQIDPGLADQVGSLIIVEHRDFQAEVIWGFVDCKSKFLVPSPSLAPRPRQRDRIIIPFRSLTTSQVSICFLGLFT